MAEASRETEKTDEYTQLNDLTLRIDRSLDSDVDDDGGGFRICFWIFLSASTQPPVTIIHQMLDGDDLEPFLVFDENRKFVLFPPRHIHGDLTNSSGDSFPSMECSSISSEVGCSLKKWIHVGYEVTRRYMRLHIDGKVSAEIAMPCLPKTNAIGVTLKGNNEDDEKIQGYVYNLQTISRPTLISEHFSKDPPLELSVNISRISEGIDECGGDIWSIIGSKASSHREFSLEVILKNAFGCPVDKEIELAASLIYVDDGSCVEKLNDDAEAPVLTCCDELEFSSTDMSSKYIYGRMSFKLNLSQLPSNCENRLFHVHFQPRDAQRYPFLEAYSPTIHCVSRNINSSVCNRSEEKLSPINNPFSCSPTQKECHISPDIQDNYGDANILSDKSEYIHVHSSKFHKVQNSSSVSKIADSGVFQLSNGSKCNELRPQGDDEKPKETRSNEEHSSEMYGMTSDSESSDGKCPSKMIQEISNSLSYALVFKYCLETTYGRSILLREIIASANEKDVLEFASQVSNYAVCSHHRYQITMTKLLLEEGIDLWNKICQSNHYAIWTDAIPAIELKFRKISRACRGLSGQDIEVLKRIAGCGDTLSRENFEKLWCWLYPVAFTLSNEKIKRLWECSSPKWIEGIITKEEAENTLKVPRGFQKPGTFILRFPTSRSWPHPDAGNIVITYVGADSVIHNKLMSLEKSTCSRALQDLILEEPELSQLAKVSR